MTPRPNGASTFGQSEVVAESLTPATAQRQIDAQGRPAILRGHIKELDVIRAVGIAVVMAAHTFPPDLSYRIARTLELGWMFMDAFFVLSGFLIAGILLDTKGRADYFRTFYVRRSLRIFPVYYLVVIALFVVWSFSQSNTSGWGSPAWFLFYLGNIPTAIEGAWPGMLNYSFIPLWSLQIEEQFYLVFPILVYWLRKETLKRVLICSIVVGFACRVAVFVFWPWNLYAQYVLLPCRLGGLAVGALIAIRYRSGPWHISKQYLTWMAIMWVGLSVTLAVAGGFHHRTPYARTIGFLISSIASAHVVVWLVEFRDSPMTAALRHRVVQYLAKLSYCMYLIHMPIAAVLWWLSEELFGPGTLLRFLSVGPLSVAGAAFSWKYIERPILDFKDRWAASPR